MFGGIVGKKLGMVAVYDVNCRYIPCTVLQVYSCFVTQLRSFDNDGYLAIQVAYGDRSSRKKSISSHIGKACLSNSANKLIEFRLKNDFDLKMLPYVGEELSLDGFQKNDIVSVKSLSKGKGFQGVVKRHGFAGVGDRTHGQHDGERASGSVGASSFPSRVFKGTRMAGRAGCKSIKISNLTVVDIVKEKKIILVSGSVAGNKGASVVIRK